MIEFRLIKLNDLGFLNEIRNECKEFLHDNTSYTLEQTIDWFNNINPEFYIIYYNNEKIGYFRTSNLIENESIYIGADLHKDYRGKGLSYESYLKFIPFIKNKHNLKVIKLEVLSSNVRAKKLYDKLKFYTTYVEYNYTIRNNTNIDNIHMMMFLYPIKIFINNFNILTWVKNMIEYFKTIDNVEIIIIDNKSTYPPLLKWYEKECTVRVERLLENYAKYAFWKSNLYKEVEGKEYYCLTDPDLDFNNIPKDFLYVLYNGLQNNIDRYKCGFSLEENDVPPENPSYSLDGFNNRPTIYWNNEIYVNNIKYYNNLIDTTFSMYSPNYQYEITDFYNSLRSDRPYTARHLPWYLTLEPTKYKDKKYILLNDEMVYYFSKSLSLYYTKDRMYNMLEEYKNKQYKFLIILLYYNRPEMVKNALNSIKLSNFYYDNWELLFIDDGSPLSGEKVLYNILGEFKDKIIYVNTNTSFEEKQKLGGSLIGKFMNDYLEKSSSNYSIMLCDDDAIHPEYLFNLNNHFKQYNDKMYVYSHVIKYNPSQETFLDAMDSNPNRLITYHNINQWITSISPYQKLDASQVCWNIKTISNSKFPYPQTLNLDASFYKSLYENYGECNYTGFVSQFKGEFNDQLSFRQWNDNYYDMNYHYTEV